MTDLPTLIALVAPALVLLVVDRVILRMLARRRPRVVDAQVPAPQVLGPAAMPIASHTGTQAMDRTAAATRRVA